MISHAELIDSLGGGTVLARVLMERTGRSLDREAVYKWKIQRVPWEWRVAVADLAKEKELPLPADFEPPRALSSEQTEQPPC